MESLEPIQETLTQMPAWQIAVLVLVLVLLVIGLRQIFKKPPNHLTAFSGDAGSVLVSRKALQELIRSACLLDEWVEAARPVIRVKNNKVTAQVQLRLARADDLKRVCERVQSHITALLQKSLSFDQIGEIQIVVKSFGSEKDEEIALATNAPPAESSLLASDSPANEPKATSQNEADSHEDTSPSASEKKS